MASPSLNYLYGYTTIVQILRPIKKRLGKIIETLFIYL